MTKSRKRKSRRAKAQPGLVAPPQTKRVPAPWYVTSGRLWLALAIRPIHLAKATRELEDAGLRVFSPTLVVAQPYRRRMVEFRRPLFPGYAFVSHDDGLFVSVEHIAGVYGYLGVDQSPLVVPWSAIARVVAYLASPPDIIAKVPRIGDIVRITQGPLEGREITVIDATPDCVQADTPLGRVYIPISYLEARAA